MKKLITVLLLVILSLSTLSACGAINKDGEVSVLWADMSNEYQFTISDALDRAMYIENINYTHYDAKGDSETQLKQADDAINAGACALIVCATDPISAPLILAKAKTANVPIVFLCNDNLNDIAVKTALALSNYDKCYIVNVEDIEKLNKTLGSTIAEDLIKNYADYDRNNDGEISYCAFGTAATVVPAINEKLKEAQKKELVAELTHLALPGTTSSIKFVFGDYNGNGNEKNATPVELILTDNDDYIEELLLALREYELNYNKLKTHFIPLYTIGVSANAGNLIESNKKEEKAAFSVMNAIDKGWLSAAALEDDDTLALSACKILANLIKDKDALSNLDEKAIVNGNTISVPYTIYG